MSDSGRSNRPHCYRCDGYHDTVEECRDNLLHQLAQQIGLNGIQGERIKELEARVTDLKSLVAEMRREAIQRCWVSRDASVIATASLGSISCHEGHSPGERPCCEVEGEPAPAGDHSGPMD